MSQRQWGDMGILAHICEQRRLSLQSYGRPRMAEERQELLVKVGHQRVGHLMGENSTKIIKTKNTSRRRTAITGSTLRQTYWRRTSQLMSPTRNGWRHQLHPDQRRLAVFDHYP
jgi:hypothetical protein